MTKRERTLAMLVGASLLVLVALYGSKKVSDALRTRRAQIAGLEKQVRDKNRMVRLSQEHADRMQDYQRRALPSDLEKARSLYQTWLLSLVKDAGFQDPQVSVLPARSEKGVYDTLAFSVSGRGDLQKLVAFLHRFYAADLLHRVRRLYAKRVPGTKQLDLAFAIDAVSLPGSDNADKLNDQPSQRLTRGDLEAYRNPILNRNLTGPANKEPALETIGDQSKYAGDLVSFAVQARDPDKWDQVTYSLESGSLPNAKIDPQSGRFEWQAEKTGDYEVVVTATDDGFPPKTARQTVKISVTERPPDMTPPPAVPPPSFEQAKFAHLTAITEADGKRQAWISLRTEGKLLKLFEGEAFPIGEVTVKVLRIAEKTVELDASALPKRLLVTLGQSVAEGRELTAPGT